ncbi:MAG TPA: prolipoprotein diacylglyceryl transferase [Candidatus Binataceae bacterium]|nr:prolipoprotein diacylglyceryl transferase [Candidatus Binataceae bacterium]
MHFVDNLNPVLMHLGPLQIRWYGVMYALSFIIGYYLICYLAPKRGIPLDSDGVAELIIYLAAGVLFGGRLGYVLFYNLPYYLQHPVQIVAVWDGGMSFHGGLIGVTLAGLLFSRKTGISFWSLTELVVPVAPLGLFFGRLGNFINGELWGRPSNVPWAMIFPRAPLVHGMMVPRHPSQLYEAILEGLVLFTILWILARKPRPKGLLLGTFLILYGLFRCFVEFFRQPDAQLGYIGGVITMGQILSIPMILIGIGIIVWAFRRHRSAAKDLPRPGSQRHVR